MTTDSIQLVTSDGVALTVPAGSAGLKTGYGRIVNGYSAKIAGFDKYTDGDTVVDAEQGEPGAMWVADAYQELRRIYDEEDAQFPPWVEIP